ncbi:hypothetical protein SAMN05216481_103355 [Streptomyces radiopugnans]|uniref:Uncharacterized protein n=1 Tax=Streptomyces radiopugnans TaxID=403935 RepID=A0A1H9CR15_9ACTN|nr:hypothetical protein SAMN05216481_103355 [Streptomyces radiopugnans]
MAAEILKESLGAGRRLSRGGGRCRRGSCRSVAHAGVDVVPVDVGQGDEADIAGLVVDRGFTADGAADVGGLVLLADLAVGVGDDVVRVGVDAEEAGDLGYDAGLLQALAYRALCGRLVTPRVDLPLPDHGAGVVHRGEQPHRPSVTRPRATQLLPVDGDRPPPRILLVAVGGYGPQECAHRHVEGFTVEASQQAHHRGRMRHHDRLRERIDGEPCRPEGPDRGVRDPLDRRGQDFAPASTPVATAARTGTNGKRRPR